MSRPRPPQGWAYVTSLERLEAGDEVAVRWAPTASEPREHWRRAESWRRQGGRLVLAFANGGHLTVGASSVIYRRTEKEAR